MVSPASLLGLVLEIPPVRVERQPRQGTAPRCREEATEWKGEVWLLSETTSGRERERSFPFSSSFGVRDLLPPAGLERGGRFRLAPHSWEVTGRPREGPGDDRRDAREAAKGCPEAAAASCRTPPAASAGAQPGPAAAQSAERRTGPSATSAACSAAGPDPTGIPLVAADRAGPGERRGLGRAAPSPPQDSPPCWPPAAGAVALAPPHGSPLLAAAEVPRCKGLRGKGNPRRFVVYMTGDASP